MNRRNTRGLTYAAMGRSAAAAGGAVAGALLAVPLGVYVAVALFENLGIPLVEEMIQRGTGGLSGLQALVGALVVFAAFIFATYLVVAFIAPIFVVLPLLRCGSAAPGRSPAHCG